MARVLIGYDGSELARDAARRALALLGDSHDVTIASVVRPSMPIEAVPALAMPAGGVPTESMDVLRREAEAAVSHVAHALGVPSATKMVTTGDPGGELCRLAGEGSYDLLVVGSHGSGFLKRILLGSASHHVLHHAPCPVLVVRPPRDDIDEL